MNLFKISELVPRVKIVSQMISQSHEPHEAMNYIFHIKFSRNLLKNIF